MAFIILHFQRPVLGTSIMLQAADFACPRMMYSFSRATMKSGKQLPRITALHLRSAAA